MLWRDWVGCVPERDLDFKGAQRVCTVIQFGRRKQMFAYSVSVALRASIALESQPGASSAKSIRGIWGVQCSRGGKKIFALIVEPT